MITAEEARKICNEELTGIKKDRLLQVLDERIKETSERGEDELIIPYSTFSTKEWNFILKEIKSLGYDWNYRDSEGEKIRISW